MKQFFLHILEWDPFLLSKTAQNPQKHPESEKSMRKFQKIATFLLAALLPLVSVSCAKNSADQGSYRFRSFTASLEGNQYGVELSCDISCESGKIQSIRYHSPDALRGMEITRSSDGSLRLEKDGLHTSFSENDTAFEGLLLPARTLLLRGADEARPRSVQKLTSGRLLTLEPPDGGSVITVTLGEDGFPTAISDERCAFRVVSVILNEP